MYKCWVCGTVLHVPHIHHVIPREYGGEDGPTVALCGDCHTNIHAEASSVLAYLRNKRKLRKVWSVEAHAEQAKSLVSAIVRSALNSGEKTHFKMHLKIDSNTYHQLQLFKQDQNFSSLSEAVLFCIRHTSTVRLRGKNEN